MMHRLSKKLLLIGALLVSWFAELAQGQTPPKTPADFGYRHLRTTFGRDSVDVLVMSKPGEEQQRKPLLLVVQGSLPRPLIVPHAKGAYNGFGFTPKLYTDAYHLVIIGKPGIPVLAEQTELQRNLSYFEPQTQAPPAAYCQRNYLDYYVARNNAVLKYLIKLPWVDSRRVVVAGHSEGSNVVAKMAATSRHLTHVVYLSGNPLGRMSTMVNQQRNADPEASADEAFRNWQQIVDEPDKVTCGPGDSPKTTYSFSVPPMQYLRKTRVPVLVVYGTRDAGAPFCDYLRLEMIREQNTRVSFKEYPGLEHNFFGFKDGKVDYENQYHWDDVAQDFLSWVEGKPMNAMKPEANDSVTP
ncbi:alpha/beta hydrolase family protein [Hymenobacter latericus]|uniref:alpha/beta hydrolase family protein n=1 Tax=Hymenobacter sp. YIM 151858-1 TaxID=2987688 RepID=UPI0022276A92|nr:esterase FrsA [Hymenobacter sp. YIM 151858-1]UYZ59489.1 esterase FrsA [Hymenobacter sp. YIM 151858-1]